MPMEIDLIPSHTVVEENGDGAKIDISGSVTRTFFCHLYITHQIEQESLDVSIWGSVDGEAWGTHPILKLPQQFYRGETRAVLELSFWPDVKFIRAHWELNKWGRGAPLPVFEMGLHLAEIPAMNLRAQVEAQVGSGD
jgi:hypothetical protein